MATTFYITAGLPAIDSADSPPSGDNKFFITAGLVANDYEAGGETYQETISDGLKASETISRVITAIESATDGVKASDAAITSYLIQHSYRFRNDDDSEAAATWKAALNTAINLGAGNTFRLRYLINSINDPASKQLQIEYRRKPSGGEFGAWKKIN